MWEKTLLDRGGIFKDRLAGTAGIVGITTHTRGAPKEKVGQDSGAGVEDRATRKKISATATNPNEGTGMCDETTVRNPGLV